MYRTCWYSSYLCYVSQQQPRSMYTDHDFTLLVKCTPSKSALLLPWIYRRRRASMEDPFLVDQTGGAWCGRPTASTHHTLVTSKSTGPTFVNTTVLPSFSSLPIQKVAQPFVKEHVVCLPNVCVAVFTAHANNGPCSWRHRTPPLHVCAKTPLGHPAHTQAPSPTYKQLNGQTLRNIVNWITKHL